MQDRVQVTLDITIEEAQRIAERIAGVGPFYEAWNLPLALDQVVEMELPEGKVRGIYIRSDASAALGGPEWRGANSD